MSNEVKTYTIEEVNSYRDEVYRALIRLGQYEDFARGISAFEDMVIGGVYGVEDHKATYDEAMSVWSDIMRYNTPQEYAEMMCM